MYCRYESKKAKVKEICMIELQGKYTSAKIFSDTVENSAIAQVQTFIDFIASEGSTVRLMPDIHAGKGCTIGTTMTLKDKVIPNVIGVDIGCGMLVTKLKEKRINLPELDSFIHNNIPSGFNVRSRPHRAHGRLRLEQELSGLCFKNLKKRRMYEACGTLGGGNHFIEADKDDEDNLYLVIHSGSRNPGMQVAQIYQDIAYKYHGGKTQKEVPYELAYLENDLMDLYLHDMDVMIDWADLNRHIIQEEIIDGLHLHPEEEFTTIHNYIDTKNMILRKGAVSAVFGQKLIIPINMRDGSLICTGLGNQDWNNSAPHGAGRLFSRAEAKQTFTVNEYKKQMSGIYSSTINANTLDECPMAYKPMKEILSQIKSTVTVDKVIKPIYNFKGGKLN